MKQCMKGTFNLFDGSHHFITCDRLKEREEKTVMNTFKEKKMLCSFMKKVCIAEKRETHLAPKQHLE